MRSAHFKSGPLIDHLFGRGPIRQLLGLFRAFGAHHYLAAIAVVTGLLAGTLEAALMGLLLPFIRGFIEGDFTLVRNSQIFEYVAKIIPTLTEADSRTTFILFSGLLVFIAGTKNLFGFARTFSLRAYGDIFISRLRQAMFARILNCGIPYIEQRRGGQLQNTLLNYPEMVSQSLLHFSAAIAQLIMLSTYIVTLLYLSWQLSVVMVVTFPILFVSSRYFSQRLLQLSVARAPWATQISEYSMRMLNAITLIKLAARDESENREFRSRNQQHKALSIKSDLIYSLVEPFQEIVSFLFLASLVGVYAFYFTADSQPLVSASRFIVFFLVLKRALTSIAIIINARYSASSLAGPLQEITELLSSKEKTPIISGSLRPHNALSHLIQLKSLSYRYESGRSIENISLDIPVYETLAVVGKSGAGKSTLIKILARLYNAPRGTYFWDGIDVCDISTDWIYPRIGLVSQEPIVLPASFRENLTFEAQDQTFDDQKLWSILERVHLKHLVENSPKGLDTLIGERGGTLSGGEKQRLAIARTILKDASLLLFDEATSALDSITEKVIQDELFTHCKNRTTIIVAHRLSTIQHANRVVVMEEGRVIELGTIHELKQSGKVFSELWRSQELKKTG